MVFFHLFTIVLLSLGIFSCFADEKTYSSPDFAGNSFDQKILLFLNYPNGVFIEVGANDGVTQSNTKRLEEFHGWTGILIEPSERLFSKLVSNRPNSKCFQCALGSFQENNSLVYGDFDGDLMSSIDGKRLQRTPTQQVLVRSLQSILDEVGTRHINFFSLDTEGYELNVLKGIDFNKTSFDYLLIEIYKHQYDGIVSFLLTNGYEQVENFSNYQLATHPGWDGSHNDYLFKNVLLK